MGTPLIQRPVLVGEALSSSVLLGEEGFALFNIRDDGVAARLPASRAHWGREMRRVTTRAKYRY